MGMRARITVRIDNELFEKIKLLSDNRISEYTRELLINAAGGGIKE